MCIFLLVFLFFFKVSRTSAIYTDLPPLSRPDALPISLLMVYGMRQRSLVPGRRQSLAELSYEFVAGMVRENVGPNGRQYFPFIFALFMFVLFCNMLGMVRSEEHTSELQSLMRISYAAFCLEKKRDKYI